MTLQTSTGPVHILKRKGATCMIINMALLSESLPIPIIASGGAGAMEHFKDTFTLGKADAALAASVFHFGEIKISELKDYLCAQGITVRR